MGKIFILGNNEALAGLNGTFQKLPKLINEYEIHNWVVKLFSDNEIGKIAIEIGENPLHSLQMAYHIRLSIEDLKEKSLVPILFVSALSLNAVILQTEIYSQILATKGVFFSEFDLQANQQELEHLVGLNESEYLTKFLKIIHIQPDETIGRHSLANIWGAYAMDKAANANALPADADFKKTLYFKYIAAFNNLYKLKPSPLKVLGSINVGSVNKIDSKNKRILFIDDEADKGWETVLRKVFKTSKKEDFVVINEKVKDFDSFSEKAKQIIENEIFDLYLIDLRLNGIEEDDNIKTNEFSGTKVLQKIKSINYGYQVIIFTASNKAWNLKALLDLGADGYYMKESPEYNFSKTISEQNYINFKETTQKCFERSYLREIYKSWKAARNQNGSSDARFIKESDNMLDIAWSLTKQEQLDFAYLTLFQIIELCASRKYDYQNNSIELNGITTKMIEIEGDKERWKLSFQEKSKVKYFVKKDELKDKDKFKAESLFKISCILSFLFEKDNEYLEYFGNMNKLRNNIAHKGAKNNTKKENLIELLRLIEEVRK